MGYNVRIIIPEQPDRDTLPSWVRMRVIAPIVRKWGGCTVTRGFGYWNPEGTVDGQEGIVSEDIWVVDTSVRRRNTNAEDWWKDLAAHICRDYDQECVFLSWTSQAAYLIDADCLTRNLGE